MKRKEQTMRESDIMHENGTYWVGREHKAYTVYKTGVTHSTSDSSYARTKDGLSIAIARCNYLADNAQRKQVTKTKETNTAAFVASKGATLYKYLKPNERFSFTLNGEIMTKIHGLWYLDDTSRRFKTGSYTAVYPRN
jgi:hypothetical protein